MAGKRTIVAVAAAAEGTVVAVAAEGERTIVAVAAGGRPVVARDDSSSSIFDSNSCTDTWQTDVCLRTYVGHMWFANRSRTDSDRHKQPVPEVKVANESQKSLTKGS